MKKNTDNIAGYTAMQFILFGFLLLFGLFVALSSFGLFIALYRIWLVCNAAVFARTEDRMNE